MQSALITLIKTHYCLSEAQSSMANFSILRSLYWFQVTVYLSNVHRTSSVLVITIRNVYCVVLDPVPIGE